MYLKYTPMPIFPQLWLVGVKFQPGKTWRVRLESCAVALPVLFTTIVIGKVSLSDWEISVARKLASDVFIETDVTASSMLNVSIPQPVLLFPAAVQLSK